MKKFLLSLLTATLILGLFSTAALASEPSYRDIVEAVKGIEVNSTIPTEESATNSIAVTSAFNDIDKHWGKDNILFVTNEKLFAGVTDSEFGPEVKMTREMFVTVLGRYEGVANTPPTTQTFQDVLTTSYSAPYVEWAAKSGITVGIGNGLFGAKENVKRQDIAALLGRYFELKETELQVVSPIFDFADQKQIEDYALDDVMFMQEVGILSGSSGNRFLPNGLATRAEVATIFTQAIKSIRGDRIYLKYGDSQIPTYSSVTLHDIAISVFEDGDYIEGWYIPEAYAFVYAEVAGDYDNYVKYLLSQGFALAGTATENGVAIEIYAKGKNIVGLAKLTFDSIPAVMVFPYL